MRPPIPNRPGSQKPKRFQVPTVVFQPRSGKGMQDGVNQIANLVRPTLGPLPHMVLNALENGRTPELLDDAGTIARRVIQLKGRDADVGAMFLRHMLWKLHETEGDGTATAAVIFQSIYNQGVRYIAAGGNAMILRRQLDAVLPDLIAALDGTTRPIEGKKPLANLARTICYDDELAKMMGEIFDVIGAYGRLEVRKGSGLEMVREYIEGVYYEEGLFSREMSTEPGPPRVEFQNAAICVTDLNIDDPQQLLPLLEMALRNGIRQILVTAPQVADRVMGLVLMASNRQKIQVALVKTPGMSSDVRMGAMEDIGILTGGKPLMKATGDRLERATMENIGRARRVWADMDSFGIIGGRGEPRALRAHIARLREAYRNVKEPEDRKRLLERLGKLIGGSAVLYVGGMSPTDIDARVELAKRTADAMRGAMRDGVLPGGGAALMALAPMLEQKAAQAGDEDARAALRMVARALQEPTRALVTNAGFHPGEVMGQIEDCGPGYGFEFKTCAVADMAQAGIFDAASVVKAAVRSAVSSAALLLTTDVIIHRKNPPEGWNT